MGGIDISTIDSVQQLQDMSERWNDLWRRSLSVRPTSRAEHLAIWWQSFARNQRFVALTLERDSRLLAALPLVQHRRRPFPSWRTLGNEWTTSGELLLDRSIGCEILLSAVVEGLRTRIPGTTIVDGALLNSRPWNDFREQENGRVAIRESLRFHAPLTEIDRGWADYLRSRSRNHVRQIKTICKRADLLGSVQLKRYEQLTLEEVEPLLNACFELEASGWKGRAGTAVLQHPDARNFFLRQSLALAESRELAIALLTYDGRTIAFEYGWQSRGVRSVLKIGYDERLSALSPGQLLRHRLFEELHAERAVRWVDFLGPATRATAGWATHQYPVGRVILAHGRLSRAINSFGGRRPYQPYRAGDTSVPCPRPLGYPSPVDAATEAALQAT